MPDPAESNTDFLIEKNRLEALVDGIFAFAMTLLVTSMILPRGAITTPDAERALLSMLPDFYHYLFGFFVLAAFWIAHHEQFRKIHHVDRIMLTLNIISLFLVTMVPFSTSFIGDYSSDPVATILFEFNLLILGLMMTLQWFYSTRNRYLVKEGHTETEIKMRMYHGMVVPVVSAIAILSVLAGFQSSTVLYMTIPVIEYGLDHVLK